jgi:DNA-binding PadR family transcriptional regulator
MSDHGTSRLSPEYVLLGFLYRNPNHGYMLHKLMEAEFENIWHASQSQTYNILKRLETLGYIKATLIKQEKLPPRQLLSITEAGKLRFEDWLDRPTKPSVHAIRVEFTSRLYFMRLYHPQKVLHMIALQVEVVTNGLYQQEQNLKDLPDNQTFNQLALELRIKLLQSVISWLKECSHSLELAQQAGDDHE